MRNHWTKLYSTRFWHTNLSNVVFLFRLQNTKYFIFSVVKSLNKVEWHVLFYLSYNYRQYTRVSRSVHNELFYIHVLVLHTFWVAFIGLFRSNMFSPQLPSRTKENEQNYCSYCKYRQKNICQCGFCPIPTKNIANSTFLLFGLFMLKITVPLSIKFSLDSLG